MMAKNIFVTGGVSSSLGKGIMASSLAKLLQVRGFKVTIQKFDPYINVDPGTMNPYEHGECYVTNDGAETDLDLGHYERFLNIETSQANNVTTGRIYKTVIDNERRGVYLGKTVQIIPHITDEIKRRMMLLSKSGDYDIVITEIGGTVGDIESLPYIESVRQLELELGNENCLVIHLTLIPYLNAAKELKTKPTQHSVKELQKNGLQPDILACRTEYELSDDIRKKLALFCNVQLDSVIEVIDVENIYDVPLVLQKEKMDVIVLKKLNLLSKQELDLRHWNDFIHKLKNPKQLIQIGLIGKYVELQDAYKSIHESFTHAASTNQCEVKVISIQSEKINSENVQELLGNLNGILVAPGFGDRGVEGKIMAINYARESKLPFFGICLGMQCAVIEFARNVLQLPNPDSTEMNENTEVPVIDKMEEQKKIINLGGTMRLGAYQCEITNESKTSRIYQSTNINERHRHRYEFNNAYAESFKNNGMSLVGINPKTELVEIIELKNHPWFIGVQFHPELKSTVANPHPLFIDFVKASLQFKMSKGA